MHNGFRSYPRQYPRAKPIGLSTSTGPEQRQFQFQLNPTYELKKTFGEGQYEFKKTFGEGQIPVSRPQEVSPGRFFLTESEFQVPQSQFQAPEAENSRNRPLKIQNSF